MLTVFPLPRTKERRGGGGETYTCTYRHRSGLDIAWVRRCALSRYTPDTAYHDFYPSIKTKGSISSFCTVPRLRWRILRSSLYTYIYVNNPVGSRCAHSRIIYVFRIRVVHVYHAFRLRVYFSRVDVGASWKISMHHICIYINSHVKKELYVWGHSRIVVVVALRHIRFSTLVCKLLR